MTHPYAIHLITHWLSCIVLSLPVFRTVKLVPELRNRHAPDAGKILSAFGLSVFNQLIALPMALQITPLLTTDVDETPQTILMKFLFYAVMGDLWFYWSHRLLHIPFFYRHIHSIHHRWTYPMPIRTLYCHPVEHILGNIGALITGPVIWPAGQTALNIWIVGATFNAVLGHSGIDFGWPIVTSKKHDIHHRILTTNYGTTGISDRLFGTRRFETKHTRRA